MKISMNVIVYGYDQRILLDGGQALLAKMFLSVFKALLEPFRLSRLNAIATVENA